MADELTNCARQIRELRLNRIKKRLGLIDGCHTNNDTAIPTLSLATAISMAGIPVASSLLRPSLAATMIGNGCGSAG
jgi:hypothetical protein